MKLQDQVCTFEQARKLNDLGIVQGVSLFFYNTSMDYSSSKLVYNKTPLEGFYNAEYCFSAFTVAELGVMIGPALQNHVFNDYITEAKDRADELIHLIECDELSALLVSDRLEA
jgi:hypothetical protein